jgi:hypothetical protein
MIKNLLMYFKKLKKFDFKKRFIFSSVILFLVGFISYFIFYFFDLIVFNFDFSIVGFRYLYYSLFMGIIGIFVSLVYSLLKNINLAIALVYIFILICLIIFSFFLVIIIFTSIMRSGTFG